MRKQSPQLYCFSFHHSYLLTSSCVNGSDSNTESIRPESKMSLMR